MFFICDYIIAFMHDMEIKLSAAKRAALGQASFLTLAVVCNLCENRFVRSLSLGHFYAYSFAMCKCRIREPLLALRLKTFGFV